MVTNHENNFLTGMKIDNHLIIKKISHGSRGECFKALYNHFADNTETDNGDISQIINNLNISNLENGINQGFRNLVCIKVFQNNNSLKEDRMNFNQEKEILEKLKSPYLINILASNCNGRFVNQHTDTERFVPYIIQEENSRLSLFDIFTTGKKEFVEEEILAMIMTQIIEGVKKYKNYNIKHEHLTMFDLAFDLDSLCVKIPDIFRINFFSYRSKKENNGFISAPESNEDSYFKDIFKRRLEFAIHKKENGTILPNSNGSDANNELETKDEVFILGQLLFQLSTYHQIFSIENYLKNDYKMEYKDKLWKPINLKRHPHIKENLFDLINKMLEINPADRITLEEVQKHDWFKDKSFNKEKYVNYFLKKIEKSTSLQKILKLEVDIYNQSEGNNSYAIRSLSKSFFDMLEMEKQDKNIFEASSESSDKIKCNYSSISEDGEIYSIYLVFTSSLEQMPVYKHIIQILENENLLLTIDEKNLPKIFCTKYYCNCEKIENCKCKENLTKLHKRDSNISNGIPQLNFYNNQQPPEDIANYFEELNFSIDAMYDIDKDRFLLRFDCNMNENIFLFKEIYHKLTTYF